MDKQRRFKALSFATGTKGTGQQQQQQQQQQPDTKVKAVQWSRKQKVQDPQPASPGKKEDTPVSGFWECAHRSESATRLADAGELTPLQLGDGLSIDALCSSASTATATPQSWRAVQRSVAAYFAALEH